MPRPRRTSRSLPSTCPSSTRSAENNEWWGTGFTEWTKVQRALPLYPGHLQPQIPTRLGYYTLDRPEVLQRQYSLASQHGIRAFCVYAYWFGGRRLLERPLRLLLEAPDLNVRYFLCWANESWSRVWDGGNDDLLMEQQHSAQSDLRIVDDLAEYFSDPRYVRIHGKPLLLIYRAELLDEPSRTARRRSANERTQLGSATSICRWSRVSTSVIPDLYGFDSAVEFRTPWLCRATEHH